MYSLPMPVSSDSMFSQPTQSSLPMIGFGSSDEIVVIHPGGGGDGGGDGGEGGGGDVGGEGGDGGGGGAKGGGGESGGKDGGGCGAKQSVTLAPISIPVLLGGALALEYTANPRRGAECGLPRPTSIISASSPRSALRGSQVPLNGSALASPGNSSAAESLQHASVRLVAVPPAREGWLSG